MKDNEKVILRYSWENLCSTEYHNYMPIDGDRVKNEDIVSDVSPEWITFNNSLVKKSKEGVDLFNSTQVPDNSLLYYKKSEKCQMNEKEWNEKVFNKLTHNMVNRVTLVLSELPGNKLKLSLFRFRKEKRAGFQNFKKSNDDVHITINRDTKNWFYTKTSFLNRKRTVRTSKNPFIWVENNLENSFKLDNIFGWYRVVTHVEAVDSQDPIRKEMVTALLTVHNKIAKLLKQDTDSTLSHNIIQGTPVTFGYSLGVVIAKWFCNQHGIKLPDYWQNYFFNFYPGIKKMRRTNMKLLPAIIRGYGIKSKYLNQLLNENPTLNINDIALWFGILGPDFFRQIPKHLLTTTSSSDCYRVVSPHSPKSAHKFLADVEDITQSLTTQEKRNIISITKTMDKDSPYVYFLSELRDHMYTKRRLAKVNEKVSIVAKTIEEFKTEHREWSALLHYLMSDQSTKYYYSPEAIEDIEKDYNDYKIFLLKDEEEYFEEGQSQKNCVRSYLPQYNSMIFSIRNTEDRRLTCEVQGGKVIQIREVCNGEPGEEWDEVILEMKNRVDKLFRKDLLKPSIKKIYKRANIHKWVVLNGEDVEMERDINGLLPGFVMAEEDDLPF
tara:strand:+ start:5398 stop:7218 length:1821 start_codon:yes stop_codon:yes gene_type:complete